MTNTALLSREPTSAPTAERLLVTWQDPETRRYHAVGLLDRAVDGSYRFSYLNEARRLERFRPFLGFSDVGRDYWSSHLFPLFAERVLDDARPDRFDLLKALDLAATTGPMEFLARSGGRRAGDCIQLLPIPRMEDGQTRCTFLVHGVRYIRGASDAIGELVEGQELALVPEPDNDVDPDAVLVTHEGVRLGWVPNPLLRYVRAVMTTGGSRLTVVRANPPELGHHLRLLVQIEGSLPHDFEDVWHAHPGFCP